MTAQLTVGTREKLNKDMKCFDEPVSLVLKCFATRLSEALREFGSELTVLDAGVYEARTNQS